MKKILIATNRLTKGGVETTLLTLLKNYSRHEYNLTLALCCRGGELEKEIPQYVKIRYLLPFDPMKLPKVISNVYQLMLLLMPKFISRSFFVKDEYDSVIAYSGDMIYYIKGAKGKKTCWIHDDWFPFKTQRHIIGRLRKKITIKILSQCENIVCVSENLKNMLIKYSESKLGNVIFLPNPVDVSKIKRMGEEQCELEFDKDKLYFVSVGRLHPVKGYDRLINVMIRIHRECPAAVLLILGAGDEQEKLQKKIEDNGAQEYIKLLGYQSNPYKYVSKCSIFICSSFMEGYSTSISEAMILGNGIISTDCGGSDQLLENGKYGILTENSEQGLEDGIRKIINNPKSIETYRIFAQKRAEELFDIQESVEDIQKIAFVCEGAYRGGRKNTD